MSRTTIQCPHCSNHTRIDFSLPLSTQKCDRCSVRLSAVNTGSKASREIVLKEPPSWRRAAVGNWDDEREGVAGQGRMPRWGWAAVGVALLLAGGAMVFLATRRSAAARPEPVAVQTLIGSPGLEAEAGSGSTYVALKARISAASAVARQFLGARTPDEVLPLIQERARLEPTVRAYYQTGEGAGTLPQPECKLLPTERQLWVDHLRTVVINYSVEGRPLRAVALREMEDGRFLVEWPSAVAFNEVPLARFLTERQTTPRLFRLLASVDDYYNRGFANDQELLCLKVTDAGDLTSLYGYARRRSPSGMALLAARLPYRTAGLPILVRLRFPEASQTDNQVEIVEFLGTGWVEGAPDGKPTPVPGAAGREESTPPAAR